MGHACISSYSIPNAFNVFFASYIDKDNSLFRDNISPSICKTFEKLLLDYPWHTFRLYNLTNADNFVKFLQPRYKGFFTYGSNLWNNFGFFFTIILFSLNHFYYTLYIIKQKPIIIFYPFSWWSTYCLSMLIPSMVNLINSIEKHMLSNILRSMEHHIAVL